MGFSKRKCNKLCAMVVAFVMAVTVWAVAPQAGSSETVYAADENLIAIAESFNDAGSLYGGKEVLEEVSRTLSGDYGSRLYGTKLAIGGAEYVAGELAKYCDISGVGIGRTHYHLNNSSHPRYPGTIYPNNHRIHGVVEFGDDNSTASIAVGRAVPAYDGNDMSEYGSAGNGAQIFTNPGYEAVPGQFLDSSQGGFSGKFIDFGTLTTEGAFDDSFAAALTAKTDVFGTIRLDAPISATAIGALEKAIESYENVSKLTGLYIASNIVTIGTPGGGSWYNATQNRSGDTAFSVPYVTSDLWKANTGVSAITMTKLELEKVAAAGKAGKIKASYRQWPEFDYSAYGIIEAETDDPDLVILVSGHIDNVTAGYGVVDDGGAVATMVELARRLENVDNGNIEIIFAAFGGEEHSDFNGAFWVIDNLIKEKGRLPVTINMNMDQVSAGDDPTWSANGNHGLNVAYGFDDSFHRGITLPLHLVVQNWVEFGKFKTQPDYITTHRSNRSAHPGNDNAATGSEYIENFSMNHGGNRYYHSSLDSHDTPGNYGLDRHQYSTNIMHAALLRAIRDNVSKRAVFDFVKTGDKMIVKLNDADSLFKTYDKITAEVVWGKDGSKFDLEFAPGKTSMVLPAGDYEISTGEDSYTDNSGIIRAFPYQNVYGHLSTDMENETLQAVGFAIANTMVPGYASKLAGEINVIPPVAVSIDTAAVSDIEGDVEYILSVSDAVDLLAVELELEVDGSMLAFKGVETVAGFTGVNGIAWKSLGGNVWRGTVTLGYPAGSDTGFSAFLPTDVAKFVFAPRAEGFATVKLTGIAAVGLVCGETHYIDAVIASGEATTEIEQLVFSKYDLNKDNKVDALDLGIMLLYCGFDEDSPSWGTLVKVNDSKGKPVTASMCDVNGDGVIDMLDLLDLFIHYTK